MREDKSGIAGTLEGVFLLNELSGGKIIDSGLSKGLNAIEDNIEIQRKS